MKILAAIVLLAITVSCHAEKNVTNDCNYKKVNLKLTTPQEENIAHSYWQTDTDGYESIDRLFVIYKNGSVAIIEHKYCSMYNFEVAFYSREATEFSDAISFEKTFRNLFSLAAFSDRKTRKSISTMIKQMNENNFDSSGTMSASSDASTEDSKRAELSLSYNPLEDSSLHKAALFIYMGIGGEN